MLEITSDYLLLSKADAGTLAGMVEAAERDLARRADRELVRACLSTIMAGFRTPDLLNPREFVALAIEALEDFPATVLARLASPKTGILRTAKFVPTISELVAWCEADVAPIRSALERASAQIERHHRAERLAQEAIDRAAAKARAEEEWKAGEPERQRRAEELRKIAEDAALKRSRDEAARLRRVKATGALMQQFFATLREQHPDLVERAFDLSEAEQDEATSREMKKPGAGLAYLLERLTA